MRTEMARYIWRCDFCEAEISVVGPKGTAPEGWHQLAGASGTVYDCCPNCFLGEQWRAADGGPRA